MLNSDEESTEPDFTVGSLDPDSWSAKVNYRGRNRMKIMFKLNQDETAAFTNFQNQTKPDTISEEAFIKSIFFLGLTTLETNLAKKITEKLEDLSAEVDLPSDIKEGTPIGEILDIPDDLEDSSDQE